MTTLSNDIRELRAAAAALVRALDRADAELQRIGTLKRDGAIRGASESARSWAAEAARHLVAIDDFNGRRGGGDALQRKIAETAFEAVGESVSS